MITTITERQRQAKTLSSVNSQVEHSGVLLKNTPHRKAQSWVVRKKFPIAVKLGHLSIATGKNLNALTQMKIIRSNVAECMNPSVHAVPAIKFSCNFYGSKSRSIH